MPASYPSNLPPPAILTPGSFAATVTEGRWYMPRHLAYLNRKLMHAAAGRIRRLMVCMPPRHGKSEFASHYFPAWYVSQFPDNRIILTSYEATFAASWGRKVRNTLRRARRMGLTDIDLAQDSSAASEWNIADHDGGMITAGVGGGITGRGGNVLIIDDPVKNREDANSVTMREKAWDWYTSTFYTRQEPGASIIVIQTRWHEDDLAGRILRNAPDDDEQWDVVNIPALAEEGDPLGREIGEALWPERYSADDLNAYRATIGSYDWSALYQQRPTTREGGYFKRGWFKYLDAAPANITGRVRFWDKAATEGGGDWTVGVRMTHTPDGCYVVEDVQRDQLSSGGVKALIKSTAETDPIGTRIALEQEPGSAGKDVIADYANVLAGHTFRGVPSTGDKQVRADPLASQAEVGNLYLVRAQWNEDFITELCAFPRGEHDDQVDAASGAFGQLTQPSDVWAG